jgi:hypothetical protein
MDLMGQKSKYLSRFYGVKFHPEKWRIHWNAVMERIRGGVVSPYGDDEVRSTVTFFLVTCVL